MCPPNSPVDPETRSTTEFADWCRNVCTLYKTPVRDTSDLLQRWHMGKRITKHRSSLVIGTGQRHWITCWCNPFRVKKLEEICPGKESFLSYWWIKYSATLLLLTLISVNHLMLVKLYWKYSCFVCSHVLVCSSPCQCWKNLLISARYHCSLMRTGSFSSSIAIMV